jgi:hypothetical protein
VNATNSQGARIDNSFVDMRPWAPALAHTSNATGKDALSPTENKKEVERAIAAVGKRVDQVCKTSGPRACKELLAAYQVSKSELRSVENDPIKTIQYLKYIKSNRR